ncbi:MAG: NRDE family protein [Desulfobacterales bacterium]|nr:NRDE family protein [Desulfobacterales bacterium]
MCSVFFAYNAHPDYFLILASNRDEFYSRPTLPLHRWQNSYNTANIIAGKDIENQGTWLGITLQGRLSVLTNYREVKFKPKSPPSRGLIVTDFLSSDENIFSWGKNLELQGSLHNGFNLIFADKQEFYYYSNRGSGIKKLEPGIYGLSNHLLDTPWPKIAQGKKVFESLIFDESRIDIDKIFDFLQDKSKPEDTLLPDTGVGLEWERILSSLFVQSPYYGTRSSSIVLIEKVGKVTFIEQTYMDNQKKRIEFCFNIS